MNTILDLGELPLVNNLMDTAEAALSAKRYPLRATLDESLTVKLDVEVDPAEMFGSYLYKSGVGRPYHTHCNKMWYAIQHMVYGANPFKKSTDGVLVVDIGGNDGTLLKSFKSQHNQDRLGDIELINVDPSSSFREDNESAGIRYIQDYWGEDVSLPKKANLIVSTNVFQHNADVRKFLAGIKKHLNGVWVLEFPYFLTTAQTTQFDQFYHEHYYYWLVTPLVKLFREYGLGIISVTEHPIHGGTLRIVSTNHHDGDPKAVDKYLKKEKEFDFLNWNNQVNLKIMRDEIFLSKLFSNGKVACFGAAAKGCVYLNSLSNSITDNLLYVVDDTKGKQGKFIPGTKLEVVSREVLYETQPEFLLILAHNFKDHIMDSLRDGYRGKFVVMFPEIEVF